MTSRIDVEHPALEIDEAFDFVGYVNGELSRGRRVDYLICDEAHFYTPAQIDQLAELIDGLGVDIDIDVEAFGIATDFQSQLFPGSQRLFELADRRMELQVVALCWCAAHAGRRTPAWSTDRWGGEARRS